VGAREEGAQHRPGESGNPSEQIVPFVQNARLSTSVRRGLLHADDANRVCLHRLWQEVQMVGQPKKTPEGRLRQQRKKVFLSHVRPKVQISIRIAEPHHRTSSVHHAVMICDLWELVCQLKECNLNLTL